MTAIPLAFHDYAQYLKPRAREAHKGDFGHVLIIGASPGFSGAARLAGEAALRVGAGRVSIACDEAHAPFLNVSCPELMCHGVKDAKALSPLLEQASMVVIGPGLGQTAWSEALLNLTIAEAKSPVLFDADALNLLAKKNTSLATSEHLFTPHPGEAARLLQQSTEQVQSARLDALCALTERYAGVMVLKGAHTLIGQNHQHTYQCLAGNPGMATAGMGDVLSGMIAGLIAQHIPLMEAACLGVLLHALAADELAKTRGERGLLASDLFSVLGQLVNPTWFA